MTKNIVHLYWGWRLDHAADLMESTSLFHAVCGKTKIRPDEITLDRKKVTCPRCLETKAERPKEPESPKITTPPDATKKLPHGEWPWEAGAVINLLTPRNPQAVGSSKHKRWSIVWQHGGKPWEKYRDAGGNPETLRNAVRQNFVKVQSW